MKVSDKGRALIASFEGLSLTAYKCPAGVWTIGYGHTQGVQPSDRLTAGQADDYLAADLVAFGIAVERYAGHCSQHEFDAMVSLAFNIGVQGFSTSSVLRMHKAGDKLAASRAFALWNKATVNGKLTELPGLTRRRAAEAAHYLTPDAPGIERMPQAVEAPAPVRSSGTLKAAATVAVPTVAVVVENAKPAIEAMQSTAETIQQAGSAWAGLKDALGIFANGHVLTVALLLIGLGALGYIALRVVRRIRRGEVSAQ